MFWSPESCQAIRTVGRFRLPEKISLTTGGVFNSAYLITAQSGHVIWLNFKLLKMQTASIKVLKIIYKSSIKHFLNHSGCIILQIYDGAYPFDSHLLLNLKPTDNKPLIGESIRSSSNHLYVIYSIYSSSNPADQFAYMTVIIW